MQDVGEVSKNYIYNTSHNFHHFGLVYLSVHDEEMTIYLSPGGGEGIMV